MSDIKVGTKILVINPMSMYYGNVLDVEQVEDGDVGVLGKSWDGGFWIPNEHVLEISRGTDCHKCSFLKECMEERKILRTCSQYAEDYEYD